MTCSNPDGPFLNCINLCLVESKCRQYNGDRRSCVSSGHILKIDLRLISFLSDQYSFFLNLFIFGYSGYSLLCGDFL